MRDVLIFMYPVVDLTVQMDAVLPIEAGETKLVRTMALEPGGGANTVFVGTRLGLDIVQAGAVGQDFYGDFLRQTYKEEGTENQYIRQIPNFKTHVIMCLNDKEGHHAYVSMLKDLSIGPPCPDDLIQDCRAVYISGIMLAVGDAEEATLALLKRVRNTNQTIFFDPGPMFGMISKESMDAVLAATDVFVLNHTEAAGISGAESPEDAAILLSRRVRGMVVIKSGAKGCYVYQNGTGVWYKGFSVPTVDTVGAGDSFLGAFIRGTIDNWDIETTCIVANAAGAAKAQKAGSGTQVPTLDEVLHILNTNGCHVTKEQMMNRVEKLCLKRLS